MIQRLQWISGTNNITFTTGEGEKFFFDPNDFDGGSVSGVYERYNIPYRDGVKTLSSRLDARQISFKAQINMAGSTEQEINEFIANFAEVFFPKTEGILHKTVGTYSRQIKAKPRRTPLLTRRYGDLLYYTIELSADDPYWLGDLVQCEIGSTLSRGYPLYFGSALTTSIIYSETTAVNNCVHDVYPIIEIFEPVKIANTTTGEFIEVTKTISSGQKLVIDTAEDTVTLYTQTGGVWTPTSDETNYITADSGILYLKPGSNTITVTKNGESLSTAVNMQWHERYAGV